MLHENRSDRETEDDEVNRLAEEGVNPLAAAMGAGAAMGGAGGVGANAGLAGSVGAHVLGTQAASEMVDEEGAEAGRDADLTGSPDGYAGGGAAGTGQD